jgi:hypothetical protein
MNNKIHAVGLCAAVLLGGCGGSDDDAAPPPVTQEVPASASTSVTSFIAYLVALVASDADALEPVDVSAVTPPTDDASEPTPVN